MVWYSGKHKKVEHLWKLEGAKERLKLVQADLMEQNSFDNAILGCKGVFHIASPVLNHKSNDPKVRYHNILFLFLSFYETWQLLYDN